MIEAVVGFFRVLLCGRNFNTMESEVLVKEVEAHCVKQRNKKNME